MTASPLGKYGELVAALISAAVIAAALLSHVVPGLAGTDTSWIDNAALLVLGVVLGQRATTNGASKIAAAAHRRLDAIHAPPADDGAPPA